MNILIVNHEMRNFYGGTQTWTITMVKALRKLGHTTHFIGSDGTFNPLFKDDFQPILKTGYDLVIVKGNTGRAWKNTAPVSMLISHGVLPQAEQPVAGFDIYLGVSEEVCENIERKGFKCAGVLRNPIDLEKFTSSFKTRDTIKTIGFLDRRRKFPFINDIPSQYKVKLIGHPPTPNVKDELDACDLVVARGRGIYEAMALGKNVIISGNNSGRSGQQELADGFVTRENFNELRKNNCSGRRMGIVVENVQFLLDEIAKATPERALDNRKLMEENNDSINIANEVVGYYESFRSK